MVDQVQLVRTVLVESLVFQVFQDLRELQVNQDDLVFKVTTENPEEVSKEHLVKMDFKDDLVPPVAKEPLDSMALKENLVCLDDPLLDHLVKMAEQDLPDHLDYLDDKELKESLVKMQSSTELFSQILHSPVHKDHQDLKGPLDSLVTLVCQV